MTQIIKYSDTTKQLYSPLPDDCIDLTVEAAQQVQSALAQDLPFVFKIDGSVSIAPSPRHKYFAQLDRWIDYAYQYSASTGACYPSDMLDQYTDKPDDLQAITADVYTQIVAARGNGLAFVIDASGEFQLVHISQ